MDKPILFNMYPILFDAGGITIYSYGFMIATGIVAGMTYLIAEGRRTVNLTFDQANSLFLLLFLAAVVGGKVFLFLENPAHYGREPLDLVTGRGFVFYGSFLFAIPAMWWFFRRNKLPARQMLDIMAITTCLVHIFGRTGCFLAGCCYGKPTSGIVGVAFTDPACYADPLNTPLYPTQLMEALFIMIVMVLLLALKKRRRFDGQMFLLYLAFYGAGRFVLEFFRGDSARGFVMGDYLSHSQAIAVCILAAVGIVYPRWAPGKPRLR